MKSNHKYVDFECVHGDTDSDGNDYMTIDGYPEDENESGAVIAVVYYTPHKDFVVHFNDNLYEDLPAVKELIATAKEDLIANAADKEKSMTLEEKIVNICKEDKYSYFKADTDAGIDVRTDKILNKKYVDMPIDTSIDIRAVIAEYCFPSDNIDFILSDAECDTLAEAIEIGAYDVGVSFRYYKDDFNDELSVREAMEQNDPTICDRVEIVCVDFDEFLLEPYIMQPANQKWFRDFINEELAGLGLPSAREQIEAAKDKNIIERI